MEILGEAVTLQTRHDANETVDKEQRYRQILAVLHAYGPLTAKECADIMARRGQIPTNERLHGTQADGNERQGDGGAYREEDL